MKKIDEKNKWIIPAVIVSLCFLLFLYFCFFKNFSFQSHQKLWPENGEVIATIDGKEYRYDPIYLYRLTNCVFDEDYRKSTDEILKDGYMIFTSTDVLYGSNMAEAAVGLELYYQEGLKVGEADIISTSIFGNESKGWYDYIPMARNTATFSVAHEKAKFYPGQSNKGFVQELEPYFKKFAYINQGGTYYLYHRDEYSAYIAERFERYNVKMPY